MPEDGRTVLDVIRQVARQSPDAKSITEVFQQKSVAGLPHKLSYSNLVERALVAAGRLRRSVSKTLGEGPRLVGVAVDEGIVLPLIQFAVLLAGCAIVPLDPEDPPRRFAHVLEDARPIAAVARDQAGLDKFAEAWEFVDFVGAGVEKPTLWLANDMIEKDNLPCDEIDDHRPQTRDVSHVFFTSGSTGRPKGCVCTHSNLLAYCKAKNKAHQINAESVVFVASASTFDPSLGDFFATWCAGSHVALAPRSRTLNSLDDCLRDSEATHVLATPALWRTVKCGPLQLPKLRVLALGGEAMPLPLAEAWSANGLRLVNTYGVTECCIYQTANEIQSPDFVLRRIGNPLHHTRLLLVTCGGSDNAQEVAEGSGDVGELFIGGPQVGQGYLRRPEITVARFLSRPDGRWFRTGDIARATTSGWDFIGRKDNQVKVNGRRVELGEVEEAMLTTAKDILEAVCVVLKGGVLIAYCVLAETPASAVGDVEDDDLTSRILRTLCGQVLPRALCPARFLLRRNLPVTGTGKVSRITLAKDPLPDTLFAEGVEDTARPGWESIVAAVWQNELSLTQLPSRTAAFAALGGDSLAALRVCQQLAKDPTVKSACSTTSSVGEQSASPPGQARLAHAPQSDISAGGVFGEALGALSPAELLKRPSVEEFAAHLRSSLGFLPGSSNEGGETTPELTLDSAEKPLETLLWKAAVTNSKWAVEFLIEKKAVVEQAGNQTTALHLACLRGSGDVVRALLDARASPNARAPQCRTPLHFAAQNSSATTITTLLAARATLASRDDEGQNAMHHAARAGATRAVCDVLLRMAIESECKKGQAKKSTNSKIPGPLVGWLGWTDSWGRTPLHWAVVNGHRGVAARLIEAEANVKVKDGSGETPLEIAERRALCASGDRPEGMGASTFGDLVTLLGGSAKTKNLKK